MKGGSTRGIKRPYGTVQPSRRSGRVTTEKLKVEIENLKANGDDELATAKEKGDTVQALCYITRYLTKILFDFLELSEMMAKKYDGSYEAVIDQAAASNRSSTTTESKPTQYPLTSSPLSP